MGNYQAPLDRTFAAPREKVFRVWTDPQALMRRVRPQDQVQIICALSGG